MSSTDFSSRLAAVATETEALLARLLDGAALPGETARPPRLLEAMRWSALGGGKRLRPFLVVEAAALFGAPRDGALLAGCARWSWCIATRWSTTTCRPWTMTTCGAAGRPCTRQFDEATAILAGDAPADVRLRHRWPATSVHPDAKRAHRAGAPSWRAPRAWAAWPADRCSIWPPKAASRRSAR